jgi:hypothetical protein
MKQMGYEVLLAVLYAWRLKLCGGSTSVAEGNCLLQIYQYLFQVTSRFKIPLYQATHAEIMFWLGGKYVPPVSKLPAHNTWRMWLKRFWATVQQNSSHLKPPS